MRQDKIKKFIYKLYPDFTYEIVDWVEFKRYDVTTENEIGDCIYITINCIPQFDRVKIGELESLLSKFFNVECSIDVYSHIVKR